MGTTTGGRVEEGDDRPAEVGGRPDDAARASAASARGCAAWAAGCTGVLLLLCGGTALLGLRALDRLVARKEAEAAVTSAGEERRREAAALLDVLALRLASDPTSLPEILPEAPPRDPWGNPVRWVRTRHDAGTLTSAGPDGRFGTRDDVARSVGGE